MEALKDSLTLINHSRINLTNSRHNSNTLTLITSQEEILVLVMASNSKIREAPLLDAQTSQIDIDD